jgi:hypothetical protein
MNYQIVRTRSWILLLSVSCVWAQNAWSQNAVFTIDDSSKVRIVPTQFAGFPSFAIIGGTSFRSTFGIEQQKPGSLESKIRGTFSAQVTDSTITFTGQNLIDVLLPDASELPYEPHVPGSPGIEDNFAATIRNAFVTDLGEVALRDAMVQLVGGAVNVGSAANSQPLQFKITSGILDYVTEQPEEDYQDLSFNAPTVTNQATGLVTGNVAATVHIPFALDFAYAIPETGSINSHLVMDGELVLNRAADNLPGDYNGNHFVDAADYVLWRNTLNSPTDHRADGDGSGQVDAGDYPYWKQYFGNANASAAAQVAPEAGSLALAAMSLLAWLPARRSRHS